MKDLAKNPPKDLTVLVPMAGASARFANAGYSLPKPLIPVDGKPMILRAIESMPEADRWIFICRSEHISKYGLDKVLKAAVPDAEIITVDRLTEGQASTCLLARDLFEQEDSTPLFIGACDNAPLWNRKKFEDLISREDPDAIAFTFTHDERLTANPKSWGWVDIASDASSGSIKKVSVKIPISSNPFNDHAIVGSFYFKSARVFLNAADRMIRLNHRVNNEFYVDQCMNEVVESGGKANIFDVDKFICWGTPEELEEYEHER